MNTSNTAERTQEHQHIWSQIPWYVNASLSDRERERVDAHLNVCAACSAELAQQRLVHRAMAGDSGVDHISSGSLNRLRQRLDAIPQAANAVGPARRIVTPGRMMLAASVSIIAVAAAVLVAALHRGDARPLPADNYYTVSSPSKRSPQEVIRAVFTPSITLAQLQALLDESHLKIVAGPTEAGVYSLASTQVRPVGDSLARLRQNPAVRFAEATGP